MTDKTLALFGTREDIKELSDRIRKMLPGGMNYTESEALTLAQMSVAHGLDPFNGEVWLIKDKDTGKVYGALIGIKGQRRHAKQQSDYWGMGHNGGFTRVTDPKMLELYGATNPNDVVYEYRIVDEVTIKAYTGSLGRLIALGMSLDEAQKMIGPAPVTLGIGVFKAGEQSKMKPSQCAMFRAEKDALKRRFDVMFSIPVNGEMIPAKVNGDEEADDPAHEEVEAEYAQFEDEPVDQDKLLEELGYGKPPEKAPRDLWPNLPDYGSLPEPVRTMTNRECELYTTLPTEKLVYMINEMQAQLDRNGLSEEKKAIAADKIGAAKAILAIRNS